MKKIMPLMLSGLIFLAACATFRQEGRGDVRPQPTSQVAAATHQALRPGLSPREVKAILGEPDDVIIYSGAGAPERWKYYHYPDGAPPPGARTTTAELVFVNGRLRKWLSSKNPPREVSKDQ